MKTIILSSLIILLSALSCKDTFKGREAAKIEGKKPIIKHLKVMKYKYHLGIQDSSGSLNEETFFDSLGNITENSNNYNEKMKDKNIFRYDSKNRLSEHLTFNKDGKLKLKTIYKYDVRDKIINELSSIGEGFNDIDKMMFKEGEKTYQYEYYNDSLLSKKIMFSNNVKKTITEYEYDSRLRLINTYKTENGRRYLSEKTTYYDNNKKKERIWFFSDGKWIQKYSIMGDTIRMDRYNLKDKIELKRIDILDSDGRYISMQIFDALGKPEYINKYYYEYY